jgi:nitrate reductase NapAB chaperone NapD
VGIDLVGILAIKATPFSTTTQTIPRVFCHAVNPTDGSLVVVVEIEQQENTSTSVNEPQLLDLY